MALDAASDDNARFEAVASRIIQDAIAGRLAPLTEEEERETDEYWEKVGEELNLTDDEIVRLVKEDRAQTAA